ncbi:hypothetical protein TNCV_1868591 [Trichonephila clavipes]|nr:hypothetical protein TNCV_1868591 [Trichonephila clavipes]
MENIALIKSSMLMKQDCFGKNANPYLHCKVRKKTSGFKAAKDRGYFIAVQQCIWRSNVKTAACKSIFKTTCIKGKDLNTLPVHWMANKKAWVTTAIFTEWFNKCFVPEVENYMNEMGLNLRSY